MSCPHLKVSGSAGAQFRGRHGYAASRARQLTNCALVPDSCGAAMSILTFTTTASRLVILVGHRNGDG